MGKSWDVDTILASVAGLCFSVFAAYISVEVLHSWDRYTEKRRNRISGNTRNANGNGDGANSAVTGNGGDAIITVTGNSGSVMTTVTANVISGDGATATTNATVTANAQTYKNGAGDGGAASSGGCSVEVKFILPVMPSQKQRRS